MSKNIKITYSLHNTNNAINIDPNKKLSVLLSHIEKNSNIEIEEYDIYIGNSKINKMEDVVIKTLLGNDSSFLVLKPVSREQNPRSNRDKPEDTNELLITKVSVEGFPSRAEIHCLLDDFLKENNLPIDYIADDKDNLVVYSFKNPDTAFLFVKEINLQKLKNKLYSKTKTNLFVDVKKPVKPMKFLNLSKSQNSKISNSLDISKSALSKSSLSHSVNRKTEILPKERSNKRFETSILRISTPYRSEEDRHLEDKKMNRKRWVVNHDFLKFVGKASLSKPKYIHNYVNLTPSQPPVLYQFRINEKSKWIAPLNFHV